MRMSVCPNKDRDEKGLFKKGNKFSKIASNVSKNTRQALTQRLLERFALRNQDGISIEELMFDIAQNTSESNDMRFKAAAKLADLIYPKTAQVELEVDDGSSVSLEEMDDKIKELLAKSAEWEDKAPDDKD